ncbi:MAG: thioredoxin-dependent thiol peroxidase [Methanobacteriota archaeon]
MPRGVREGLGGTLPDVGETAPDFALPSDDGRAIALKDLRGKKVVLYFYPKDDTPGCTKEACAFRDNLARVTSKGAVVLGVSRDDLTSHGKFRDRYRLNFPLLSDESGGVTKAYGVWQKKTNYGREYWGIVRSTFLIDEAGRIARVWPKVKVEGHADEVLAAL